MRMDSRVEARQSGNDEPFREAERLTRQARRSHEELVHRMRSLPTLADCPDDERLAAPHVACSEHLGVRRLILPCVRRDIAAWIELEIERLDHALVHGVHEAHGEKTNIRPALELSSVCRLKLCVAA